MKGSGLNRQNSLLPVEVGLTALDIYIPAVSRGGAVVSKHGLYAGGPGSILTAITTMTAAGRDDEQVFLNH